MLLSTVWTPGRADRVRQPFEGGFVSIDARVETSTRRRAAQHQYPQRGPPTNEPELPPDLVEHG
jgi:hypothetical protein